jgi:hypothetical protein
MLKISANGTQASASTAIKFSLRPTAETLADLSRPIGPSPPQDQEAGHDDPDLLPLEHHCPPPSPPCPWLVLGSTVRSGGWWCCVGYWATDHPNNRRTASLLGSGIRTAGVIVKGTRC